jgi:hypothetical protein
MPPVSCAKHRSLLAASGLGARGKTAKSDAYKVHALVRILVAPPVITYLILHILLSFQEAYFLVNLRGLPVSCSNRFVATRDFGRGRYENLSGAISWLTFFAGRAAHVRRSQRDWRRELAESTIRSQQKPRSFCCSAQSVGSRGVRRINVLAVSCGGFPKILQLIQ